MPRADITSTAGCRRRDSLTARVGRLSRWVGLGLGVAGLHAVQTVRSESVSTPSGEVEVSQLGYPTLVGATVTSGGSTEVLYGLAYQFPLPYYAGVVGRWVFYNESWFDGRDPASNALDDGALAPDKTALRAGEKAGFANYTSYSRGLNGIMVDIAGLFGDPTTSDFTLVTGNSDQVASWSPAPPPQSVSVRRGAGVGGSDRVSLVWGSNAPIMQWLGVRVRVTSATGLPTEDVFFFGNAPGESGNHPGVDAIVDSSDELGARQNPRGPFSLATLTNAYDFDRDQLVNATDVLIARARATTAGTALRLVTPVLGSPAGAAVTLSSSGAETTALAALGGSVALVANGAVTSSSLAAGEGVAEAVPRLTIERHMDGGVLVRLSGAARGGWELQGVREGASWAPVTGAVPLGASGADVRTWRLDPVVWESYRLFRVRSE